MLSFLRREKLQNQIYPNMKSASSLENHTNEASTTETAVVKLSSIELRRRNKELPQNQVKTLYSTCL